MTIEEIEQELFEMERKLESMFNSCSQDLAIGIEKLRGELAELKESKKEGKWKPAQDEVYFFRGYNGIIIKRYNVDNQYDEWRINNIPIFKTKEACERYWHFMDTVKEKSYEFSREQWENTDIVKYYIRYDYEDKNGKVDYTFVVRDLGKIYFKTEEDAQYIIDNFKEELMEWFL